MITFARVLPHLSRNVPPAAQVTPIVIVQGPDPLTDVCGVPAVGSVHVGVVRAGVVGLMARTPGESAIVGAVQPAGIVIVTCEPAAMAAVAVKLKSSSSRDMPGVTVGSAYEYPPTGSQCIATVPLPSAPLTVWLVVPALPLNEASPLYVAVRVLTPAVVEVIEQE